ncbi:MAG: Stk1 family PASTA domain-containing Ser/Thr kinase [Streptosporangiaceae bacterium]
MTEPRLLGHRYELDGVVGRGGMAEVYRGRDIRLDRQVAVKTLRADLARDPTFQTRFRREAQSAASLNHPAVIAIYDTGEDYVQGASVPYIVMEYVEGRTLRDILRDDRRLLPERALEITDGILRALDYSHRGGIVHRDIKPANIMLTPTGDVKVMDFGIARAIHDATSTVTQTAQVIGTAQYLSPEQARGERVDARSDIYSTGCVLYELLTGRPPFSGDSPVAIAYQHVREDPVPPSQIDPEIPPWADAIALKALAKNPDNRYQDAAEMRNDIQRALMGQRVEAPTVLATAGPTQRLGPGAPATQALPPDTFAGREEERRRRWPWILLLVLVLLAAAGFGGYWLVHDLPAFSKVSVPNVVGKTRGAAQQQMTDAGLDPRTVFRNSKQVDQNHVIRTDPAAGTEVGKNSAVTMFVSKGVAQVQVPSDLVGQSKDDAAAKVEGSGLQVGNISEKASTEPADQVIATSPAGGESVPPGSAVDLVVSTGATKVPSVVGKGSDDAYGILKDAGFDVATRKQIDTDHEAGTVIYQNPDAGTPVQPGSTVTITVAKAPPQETTPPASPSGSPPATPPGQDEGNGNGNGDGQGGGPILP